jgi:hypothetical protein
MNRSRVDLLHSLLPSWTVFTILAAVYLWTIAPGLTWANGGSDGGDLISAAATGGIAHPTGYPLYLLLARLFQFLPLGSLAFRTNLMSALAMALAGSMVCDLVIRSISTRKTVSAGSGGLAAGLAFGLAPVVWSQAVITEVYALQALLTVLVLQVYTLPEANIDRRWIDGLRGVLLGLAVCNHLTGLLLVPAAVLVGALHSRSTPRFDRASLPTQLLGFVAGLALYLILPLRALTQPPVNWGNVTSLERFWWLVSGGLYQSSNLQASLPALWERIQSFAALLLEQFGSSGLLLGLLGLVVFGSRSRLYLLTAWTALAYSAFALFYRSVDFQVYLIPALLSLAVWMGLGLSGAAQRSAPRYPWLGTALAVCFILYLGVRSVLFIGQVDASKDTQAETFGSEVLSSAPQEAILFVRGDRAVFTLWYFHFALDERPDLALVAEDLLHFDWYQETLRSTYPAFVVTGPFPWPETIARENPGRATCNIQYTNQPEISCMSAGITP